MTYHYPDPFDRWRYVHGQPGGYTPKPNTEPQICPHCHRALGGQSWAWAPPCDCDICRGVREDVAGV